MIPAVCSFLSQSAFQEIKSTNYVASNQKRLASTASIIRRPTVFQLQSKGSSDGAITGLPSDLIRNSWAHTVNRSNFARWRGHYIRLYTLYTYYTKGRFINIQYIALRMPLADEVFMGESWSYSFMHKTDKTGKQILSHWSVKGPVARPAHRDRVHGICSSLGPPTPQSTCNRRRTAKFHRVRWATNA